MNTERNINIRLVTTEELPLQIKGICGTADKDDSYIMALNGNYGEHRQLLTFLHECLHIWHKDFTSGRGAQEIEAERHRELVELLEELTTGNSSVIAKEG